MKSSALRHPARLAGASLLRLQSDARLAELAVTGHEAAFDAIVDRYRPPLLRYCAGIVGPSRAEDAVQQALINAHDAMTRTDEVRHLKPWLYRIAHNAALNVLRAVRDDAPLDDATLGAAHARAAGPDESFERSEQFHATLAALQALPERQRAALVLRELEGRSHEEIADALGVTKGSARQHLMRARVAVRSAVTAITPYPLVARFAEMLSGSGGGAGWVDAAAGAGASATLMKLGAGVAATGALVGGAVGTQHVVRGGPTEAASVSRANDRADRDRERRDATPVVQRASEPVAVVPAALPERATPRAGAGERAAKRRSGARKRHQRHAPAAPVVPASAPPAAAAPAVESATSSHRGRRHSGDDDQDGRHGHRGRGQDASNDRTDKQSDHGRSGRDDDTADGRGDKDQQRGHGKDGSSSSGGKDKSKDDEQSSTPASTPEPTSGSDKDPGSGNSGHSGETTPAPPSGTATTPTSTTPTTSTTPATTPADDEG